MFDMSSDEPSARCRVGGSSETVQTEIEWVWCRTLSGTLHSVPNERDNASLLPMSLGVTPDAVRTDAGVSRRSLESQWRQISQSNGVLSLQSVAIWLIVQQCQHA